MRSTQKTIRSPRKLWGPQRSMKHLRKLWAPSGNIEVPNKLWGLTENFYLSPGNYQVLRKILRSNINSCAPPWGRNSSFEVLFLQLSYGWKIKKYWQKCLVWQGFELWSPGWQSTILTTILVSHAEKFTLKLAIWIHWKNLYFWSFPTPVLPQETIMSPRKHWGPLGYY